MADELKRVGLIFTQEGAVDFKKTLQEVNIEMNKNYNQFKLTQAQWNSSTKSTEKLRVEQEYLRNAYEIQADKVSTLKMQLSDLENVENKNTTAIKKKRNELTNAELKLETYNKRIKDIDNQLRNSGKSIEEFGTKIKNTGDKVEKAGKKVSAFSVASASALVACAKSAIDFETAFTGVEKTVDGTVEQMAELKQGIRDMAKEIPSSATEISAVAEAAGQLGIKTENILSFSKAMIDLGNSTNLSADEAASSLAKFANIMGMSQTEFDRLGSSIVDLGNHFATTEADIVEMSMRLAGAGKQVGLSEGQVLGLATALSSVGIEAEMGGSAISKAMVKMQNAVEQGGIKLNDVLSKTGMTLRELELMSANDSKGFKDMAQSIGMTSTEVKQLITAGTNLEDFAKISGMTAGEFKKAWKEDAAGALSAFIKGLGDAENKGESAITMLSEMGLTEVRLRDSLLRAANAGELFTDAIETGTKAWEDNTALTNEANKRYETLASQISIAVNKLKDIAITVGTKLMPSIQKIIDSFGKWIEKFQSLSDEQVDLIVKLGLIVAAIGPVVTIVGKLITTIGGTTKAIGTIIQAFEVMSGTLTTTSGAVNGLAKVFSVIASPVGLACAAIGVAVAGIAIACKNAEKDTKEAFSNMESSATDFITGIDSAQSHLSAFNSELFVSAQEQQELKTQMDEVQKGITTICKTASDERRGYTQEEITQLDEYFTKLRELNQREIEIQQQISEAITQQAVTNSQTFQGSLEEYKVQSQEWIKTAEEQKNKTIELINNQTIEEVALLNTRYITEEERQGEAYQKEYEAIMEQKQAKIDAANSEVAEICQIYTNGYLERSNINEETRRKIEETNNSIEIENDRHAKELEKINEAVYLNEKDKFSRIENENYWHQQETKKIWNQMYSDMSEEQQEELGVWLAKLAQTEMYGGDISEENQKMVDTILKSYESMPEDAKEKMNQTMAGMLKGMEDKEPSLFAKASSIANGILSKLKSAFEIHSPSKKTRAIFKNVMKRYGTWN